MAQPSQPAASALPYTPARMGETAGRWLELRVLALSQQELSESPIGDNPLSTVCAKVLPAEGCGSGNGWLWKEGILRKCMLGVRWAFARVRVVAAGVPVTAPCTLLSSCHRMPSPHNNQHREGEVFERVGGWLIGVRRRLQLSSRRSQPLVLARICLPSVQHGLSLVPLWQRAEIALIYL